MTTHRDGRITIPGDDGKDIELPTKWAICSTCDGNGKNSLHIDGNGITQSEMQEWDEESWEIYLRGGYDKPCHPCSGSGKVRVVDEDRLTPQLRVRWVEWEKDEAEYRAACEMERRMGA